MPVTNINAKDWEEFEERLKEVRESEAARGRSTDFLYRGLGDSNWTLETTLERAGRREMAASLLFLK